MYQEKESGKVCIHGHYTDVIGRSHSAVIKLSIAVFDEASKAIFKTLLDMFNKNTLQGSILEFQGTATTSAYVSGTSGQLGGT
ncbi:hypothetical protein BGX27_004938, partial [Mortierella sp. AM989]